MKIFLALSKLQTSVFGKVFCAAENFLEKVQVWALMANFVQNIAFFRYALLPQNSVYWHRNIGTESWTNNWADLMPVPALRFTLNRLYSMTVESLKFCRFD